MDYNTQQNLYASIANVLTEDSAQTVEVNVGLNIFDKANNPDTWKDREEKARHIINQFASGSPKFRLTKSYEGSKDYGSDFEPTLVAQLKTSNAVALCNRLAKDLEQEAVAYYNLDTKKGELIGPKAKEWGGFNPEYFETFSGNKLP